MPLLKTPSIFLFSNLHKFQFHFTLQKIKHHVLVERTNIFCSFCIFVIRQPHQQQTPAKKQPTLRTISSCRDEFNEPFKIHTHTTTAAIVI